MATARPLLCELGEEVVSLPAQHLHLRAEAHQFHPLAEQAVHERRGMA